MVISGSNLKVVAVQLSEGNEMDSSNGTQNESEPKRAPITVRRRHALELRMKGLTFAAIARQVGYESPSGAFRAVRVALHSNGTVAASDIRELHMARLDVLLGAVWDAACRGEVKAINSVLRVLDRQAKLLGLNLPPQPENPPEELPVKAYINFPMDDI